MPNPTTPPTPAEMVAALHAEADRLEAQAAGYRMAAGLIDGSVPVPPLRLGETIAPVYRQPGRLEPEPDAPAEPEKPRRRNRPRSKVTLEQVRDWVVHDGREPFRPAQVVAALDAPRGRVATHLQTLVQAGIVEELGKPQARRYRYVPPPHGTAAKAFQLTANGDGEAREPALPVPGTGRPAGPTSQPSGRPSPARRGPSVQARR